MLRVVPVVGTAVTAAVAETAPTRPDALMLLSSVFAMSSRVNVTGEVRSMFEDEVAVIAVTEACSDEASFSTLSGVSSDGTERWLAEAGTSDVSDGGTGTIL